MCIKSILDTDLYKFTTSYAYMKLYPDAEGTFEFCDRANTVYNDEFLEMFRLELANLATLKMSKDEFEFVNSEIRFIPQCYWKWLSLEKRGDIYDSIWDMRNAFLEEQQMLDTPIKVIMAVTDRHFKSEFKRKQLPIKITREEIV